MKITETLLKALGCEVECDGVYVLKSNGYHFFFQWYTHYEGTVNEHTGWAFHVDRDTLEKGWNYGHNVTDLEECFGVIANDLFEIGKQERSTEIRELLGIKMEGQFDD